MKKIILVDWQGRSLCDVLWHIFPVKCMYIYLIYFQLCVMAENVLKMHTVTKTHANVMMVSMEMVILNVKVSILNL